MPVPLSQAIGLMAPLLTVPESAATAAGVGEGAWTVRGSGGITVSTVTSTTVEDIVATTLAGGVNVSVCVVVLLGTVLVVVEDSITVETLFDKYLR